MPEKGLLSSDTDQKQNRKKRTLSKRQKSIIHIMVEMGGNPVTVAAISEKLSVSTRTILREMPDVENWLFENDFRFVKKRGRGIAIDETPENLALVEELLDLEKGAVHYSKDDRRTRILGTLFFAVSPIKAYVFTSQYDISEGTLYGDLEILEAWLKDYDIKINRRPGLGIFMTGEETSRRQAIINALFEFFDINRIPVLLDRAGEIDLPDYNHPLIPFFNQNIIPFAKSALQFCEDALEVRFVDNSQISLISRISLAVYRMENNRYLRSMPKDSSSFINNKEYETALQVGDQIREHFDIDVTKEEISHLAVYLATSRVLSSSGPLDDPMESIHLRHVVSSMIGVVERMTDIPFHSDHALIDDLAEHVAVMKKRLSMDLILGNSQASAIKDYYPGIYSAVETACQVLTEWVYPKDLKVSDIGFISIHFAAAAERLQKNAKKVAVAVVCPAGIASSKMLAASLVRFFPEIEVKKITSAFSIDEEQLQREGIDLIISTAQIHTAFPHLCVDKVLQVQDKMRIKNFLTEINHDRIKSRTGSQVEDNITLSMKDVDRIAGLGTEIVELVEHFRIVFEMKADSVGQLMEVAADALSESGEMYSDILNGFMERERISDTYLDGMEICLLHCRSRAVSHSRFIYISLVEPLMTQRGLLKGAIAMTVPREAEDDILLEPVGRLSALLVENPGFLQALHMGDQTAGVRHIEKALVKYYQQEVTKIMEV